MNCGGENVLIKNLQLNVDASKKLLDNDNFKGQILSNLQTSIDLQSIRGHIVANISVLSSLDMVTFNLIKFDMIHLAPYFDQVCQQFFGKILTSFTSTNKTSENLKSNEMLEHVKNLVGDLSIHRVKNLRHYSIVLEKLLTLFKNIYLSIDRLPLFEKSNIFTEYQKLFIEAIKEKCNGDFNDQINELEKYFLPEDRMRKFCYLCILDKHAPILPNMLNKTEITDDPNVDTNEEDYLLIFKKIINIQVLTDETKYRIYLQSKRSKFSTMKNFMEELDDGREVKRLEWIYG